MESIRTRGLSSTGLKWIALILMVLDHIHYFFAYTGRVPEWFSMAGRLAAPLFLFCLVEGFSHTHDRRRYFMKVYAIHLLMSGLLLLMLCGLLPIRPDGFYPMNGMMTSFAILMVVFQGIDWLGEKRWGPGLAAVLLPLAWPILAGTLMGTIISTSCISAIVEPYALFRYYFHKGFYQFMREQLKYAVITIGIAVLTIAACRMVNMDSLLAFVIQMGFCLMVPNLCMGIIFWKDENFIYFRRHIKQFALFKK